MLLLDTEEEISGSTPHELGKPTPLRSRRLGPQCRAKNLSSSPGSLFESDNFVRLVTVGLTDPLLRSKSRRARRVSQSCERVFQNWRDRLFCDVETSSEGWAIEVVKDLYLQGFNRCGPPRSFSAFLWIKMLSAGGKTSGRHCN